MRLYLNGAYNSFVCLSLDFNWYNHEWWGWEDLSSLCRGDGFDWPATEAMQMWLWGVVNFQSMVNFQSIDLAFRVLCYKILWRYNLV